MLVMVGGKTRETHYKLKEREHGTHDCAFLEPLAFPPDLPPVILIDFEIWLLGDEK